MTDHDSRSSQCSFNSARATRAQDALAKAGYTRIILSNLTTHEVLDDLAE